MADTEVKVQRKHLPMLGAYVQPRTPTENILEKIWRRAFSMDLVGIADSYEDLGGDSLIAASILSEIEATSKIRIPLGLLDETSTIEQLAREIDKLQQKAK